MKASKVSSKHAADGILLIIVIALTLFGLMMIASASSVVAERFRGDIYFFLKHQLFYGGPVGLAAFLLGFFVPYRQWRLFALPALMASLVLLVLVFVPGLQLNYGGASRWISLGPITLQPTEITKIAFILYLAALLERKGEDIHDFKKSVVPFLIITGVIATLIILQPDIGTLFTIVVIAGTMVLAAGFKLSHLALISLGGAAVFAVLFNTAKYRLARILVYLHPELDPQGVGYQVNQALLAVGSGRVWGLGFGRSRQKYQYLPEPAGDSIFAIVAEELGLIRTLLVIGAFAVIGVRGFTIARRAPDVFGQLLACGITSWILIQAFINMGSILALTPLTGIPLPFISYGSSALVSMLFAVGILLNISKYTKSA
ncbi:MAG: putative lipid II flippase FtsW [Candidatus Andersenbacteria bacterium]